MYGSILFAKQINGALVVILSGGEPATIKKIDRHLETRQ